MCGDIEIYNDTLVEVDETVAVTATFEQSVAGISLISDSASTTITDNDCKPLFIYIIAAPPHQSPYSYIVG